MQRRGIRAGLGLAVAILLPASAHAQDLTAQIVEQLTRQGFEVVVQERTMLGRVRIGAERDGGFREIVFNPNTGEILRDLWQPAAGGVAVIDIIEDVEDLVEDDDLVDEVAAEPDENAEPEDGPEDSNSGSGHGGGGGGGDDGGDGDD